MKKEISIDLDLTFTNICGFFVLATGLISMFILRDSNFAGTCILTGGGMVGVAKVANTSYDNNHVNSN